MKRQRVYANAPKRRTRQQLRAISKSRSSIPRLPAASRRAGTNNPAYARFNYAHELALNPGAGGTTANQQFRLSSLFDPDLTGVGHQPVNHDQYALIYERYQVLSVKYTIYLDPNSTTSCIAGMQINDTADVTTDPRVYIENGNSAYRYLSSGDGIDVKKITGSIQLSKVHGVTDHQYKANDDYGAAFGNNPVENCIMTVWAAGLGGADAGTVGGYVVLEYYTKLMGTRLNGLS